MVETPLSDKDIYCTTAEEIVYSHKDVRDAVRRLQNVLISRMCRPNKPVNTFQNAREHEEIIKEEVREIFGKELCEDNSQEGERRSSSSKQENTPVRKPSMPDTRKGCGKVIGKVLGKDYLPLKCGDLGYCPSCQEKMKEVKEK